MTGSFTFWRRSPQAAVDDSAWVLEKYEEAKELIADIREAHRASRDVLSLDLFERVDHFWASTFMDRCTTMGNDCGCNTHV